MKNLNTKALLVFLPLLLISVSTIAYASIQIVSNIQTVEIQYVLVLSSPSLSGSTVTMSATLTNGGNPVANAQIGFFHCASDGTISGANTTALNTIVTNGSGVATLVYTESANGIFHYIAVYNAP